MAPRPPSQRPPPPTACPPAATFAQLCLVFSCLPSLWGEGGGGAWGYEHCLHLGLSQRRTRQAAPTPAPRFGKGRAGPRLPSSLGGADMGSGGARQGHTPFEAEAGAGQALPGSTATHGGHAGPGTLPEPSGASKDNGQCPTEH